MLNLHLHLFLHLFRLILHLIVGVVEAEPVIGELLLSEVLLVVPAVLVLLQTESL